MTEPMALNVPGYQSPKQAEKAREIEQRRLQVAAMLVTHRTYKEMAEQLKCSVGTIASDVAALRTQWRERAAASTDAWMAEELAKLDMLETSVLSRALKSDSAPAIIDRALAIQQRRAKLMGLDAPERHEFSGPDGGAIPIAERVQRLGDEAEDWLKEQTDQPQLPEETEAPVFHHPE